MRCCRSFHLDSDPWPPATHEHQVEFISTCGPVVVGLPAIADGVDDALDRETRSSPLLRVPEKHVEGSSVQESMEQPRGRAREPSGPW